MKHPTKTSRGPRPTWTVLALLISMPWLAAGCSEGDAAQEIPEVRQARKARARVLGPLTEAVRFAPDDPKPDRAESQARGGPEVIFDLPEGWVEKTPTRTRQINVAVAERPDIECYLAILPGRAGGGLANVNRWRDQMGLGPVDQAAVDALPSATLLGRTGVFLDIEGAFTGMGGPVREGWRMAGLIVESGGMTAFLKMTGPTADMAAEVGALRTFAESIRIEERGAGGGDQDSSAGLVFTTPEGWEKGAPRQARLITFHPGGNKDVECYVTMLGGDGGGVLANLNRWRDQLGAAPMKEEEVSDLPTVALFGKPCPVLTVEGAFTGMVLPTSDKPPETKADHALIGTVLLVPQAAIFVKLIGPKDLVLAERESFVIFCESLGF